MIKKEYFYFVSLLLFMIFFQGCYEQTDVLSVTPEGKISIVTDIIVPDKECGYTFEVPNEAIDAVISDMGKNGWTISKKILSKKRPFKFQIVSKGDIRWISETGELYSFRLMKETGSKGHYVTSFKLLDLITPKPFTRTIIIKTDNLFDENNKLVKTIQLNEKKRDKYFLKLN